MKYKKAFCRLICTALCILTIFSAVSCQGSSSDNTEDDTSDKMTDSSTDKGTISDITDKVTEDTEEVTSDDTDDNTTTEPNDTSSADTTGEGANVSPDTTSPTVTPADTTAPVTTAPSTTSPTTNPPATVEPTEKTEKPEVLGVYNCAADRVIIFGKCEVGSVITSRISDGRTKEKNESGNGYFYVEQTAGKLIVLTATAPGKKESDERTVRTIYNERAANQLFGGQNSRLFYGPTLPFYLGQVNASGGTLNGAKQYANNLKNTIRAATGKNTKIIYMICPNPATIYYDEMRSYISNAVSGQKRKTAAWQFVEAMQGEEGFIVPNLYEAFENYKDEDIFYRTDTHWSELGAFYAYKELMKSVKKDFPKTKTYSVSDFEVKHEDVPRGDLGSFIGGTNMRESTPFLYPKFTDTGDYYTARRMSGASVSTNVGVYPTTSKLKNYNSSMPSCYFIGDSYGANFLPFCGMSFGKMFANGGVLWQYTIDYELLKREKPDYVMFIYTDRNIDANLGQIFAS